MLAALRNSPIMKLPTMNERIIAAISPSVT